MAGFLIREHLLVGLVGCKADSHLWDNSTQDSSETLVKTEGGFLPDDVDTGSYEAARFYLLVSVLQLFRFIQTYTRRCRSPRQLHADFDGI